MEIFSFLLLVLLIVFIIKIVGPLIRVVRAYSKLKKGDLSGFASFFNAPGNQKSNSAYTAGGERKAGWSKKRPRKKKIGADVGEYVKFSEVETQSSTVNEDGSSQTTASYTSVEVEQQVTDVEWEDL